MPPVVVRRGHAPTWGRCDAATTDGVRWALVLCSALALLLSGCSTNRDGGPLGASSWTTNAAGPGACGHAAPGCACAKSGELAACTQYEQRSGNYATCQTGTMVCKDGVWGGCAGPSSAQKLTLSTGSTTGIRTDA